MACSGRHNGYPKDLETIIDFSSYKTRSRTIALHRAVSIGASDRNIFLRPEPHQYTMLTVREQRSTGMC
jgi:hypothetical protein